MAAAKKLTSVLPGTFKTATEKLQDGIWPWTNGIRARFPFHYKQRYVQKHMQEPIPVHYTPEDKKWTADKHGQMIRVQNIPIPVLYPKEAGEGLWSNIGIVKGFCKKNNDPMKPRTVKFWRPRLRKKVFYSEILDKHMEIVVSTRTLDMVDAAYGFDFYILKTHEVDLNSRLGMRLKREMLRTLANRTLYPNNEAKQEEIINRYKEFIIPAEEAEWVGLSLKQAEEKQMQIEEERDERKIEPLKYAYMHDLINRLDEGGVLEDETDKESSGLMSKLNPFKKE